MLARDGSIGQAKVRLLSRTNHERRAIDLRRSARVRAGGDVDDGSADSKNPAENIVRSLVRSPDSVHGHAFCSADSWVAPVRACAGGAASQRLAPSTTATTAIPEATFPTMRSR